MMAHLVKFRITVPVFLMFIFITGPTYSQEVDPTCQAGDPTHTSPLIDHQVFFGIAENGVIDRNQSQLIIDSASVPDGVVGPDGKLWVYYVNGTPGAHGIFASVQQDDGTWSVVDCIQLDGVFNGNAVDPDIIRLADGRYRLFYFEGHFVDKPPPGTSPETLHPIYSAISEDGLHFEVEGLVFEYPAITDPTVVQLPDQSWLMAAAYIDQVVIASSPDGQQYTMLTIIDDRSIPELSLDEEGAVLMWGQKQWRSLDNGHTWQTTSVPSLNPDPSLVHLEDDLLVFFYKDFAPGSLNPPNNDNPPPRQ